MKRLGRLAEPYRVDEGSRFHLKHFNPADTGKMRSKEHAAAALQQGIDELQMLQDKLYAQDQWGVLLILQGMDASGKDGIIKHVMSGVNPQGCQVYSFKEPSHEELNHDFLWRTMQHKWFARLVVAAAVVDTLESLKLSYLKVDAHKRKELDEARKLLEKNKM